MEPNYHLHKSHPHLQMFSSVEDEITQSMISSFSFQIRNENGHPAFFAPCRDRRYSPLELTSFLIKKLMPFTETTLDRRIQAVQISIHHAMGFLAKALYEAAERAHSATTATLSKLRIDEQKCGNVKKLISAIDTRSDGCDCVLSVIEKRRLVHHGMISRSRGNGFLDKELAASLSRISIAHSPATSQTVSLR